MIDVILQIWDLGGQERFDFLKDTYFKGAAAVALVFDLSNPESFENLTNFLIETRKVAGPIPILLIGNKNDLEEELGEIISRDEISDWMRIRQITDFIKTSAKTGDHIDSAFEKLSILSLIDLKEHPRVGEFRKDGIFRFKIIFVGSAGVGKTSIIRRFADNIFQEEYKLTVGLDFITKKIVIDEQQLPEEALINIRKLRSEREQQLREKSILEEVKDEIEEKAEEELEIKLEGAKKTEEILEEELERVEELAARVEEKALRVKEEINKEESKPIAEENEIEEKKKLKPTAEEKEIKEKEIEKVKEKIQAEPMPPPPPMGATAPKPISYQAPLPPKIRSEAPAKKAEKKRKKQKPISYQSPLPPTTRPGAPMKKAEKKGKKQKKLAKPSKAMMAMTEEKLLRRKTTVFYKKQMNPQTLNKLSVILSTEKIFEELKQKVIEAERKASGKTLEIKELSPYVEVRPIFPGCICVPSTISLDARKEADTANFQITPLAVGHIKDARVLLYYENQLIDIIKTPTKVVKQTGAKISGSMAVILPIFGPLFDNEIGKYLGNLLSFYNTIGGIQGFFLILSGIAAIIGGLFYLLKRPKEAEPVESIPNFPEIEEILKKEISKI